MVNETPKEVLTPDRNHYVVDNLKVVHYILNKYIKPRPEEYEDCYQQGCIGLTLSAIRFKEELGYQFLTYAVPMIIGTIKEYLRKTRPSMRYPRKMNDLYCKIQQLKSEGLDDDQILKHLNLDSVTYFDALNMYNITSLEQELSECEDGSLTLGNVVSVYDEEPDWGEVNFEKALKSVVEGLSDTYRAIYEEYIYSLYCGGEKLKQEYFVKKYGISQAQVSRILKKLNKLYKIALEQDNEI